MGRSACPSRKHFKKEVTTAEGTSKQRVCWRCVHCSFAFQTKRFAAGQGRIHLAADLALKNSQCMELCTATDELAVARRQKFRELERAMRGARHQKVLGHKRQLELLGADSNAARLDGVASNQKKRRKQLTFEEATNVGDKVVLNDAIWLTRSPL